MKKLILLFTAIFCLSNLKAQYNFTNTTGTFTPLTAGTNMAAGFSWDDDEFNIPVGFTFYAYGKGYDSVVVESNGSLFLHNGLTYNTIYAVNDTIPAFAGNTDDLLDRGSSPILYQVSGSAGSRVLTVEFRNAGYYDDGGVNDFVNFQFKLFEGTGTIEIHYGPTSVPAGTYYATVGLSQVNFMNGTQLNPQFLSGAPASPTLVNFSMMMNDVPSNGRLYRFTDITLDVNDVELIESVKFYPNPANDILNVEMPTGQSGQITLLDITGKELSHFYVSEGNSIINLHSLSPGVYLVRMPSGKTDRLVIH